VTGYINIDIKGVTTTILSGPANAPYNSVFTLTATVSPATATGTVDFYLAGDTNTALATNIVVTNGMATFDLTNNWTGTNDFMAVYSGDSHYAGSAGYLSDWLVGIGGPNTNGMETTPGAVNMSADYSPANPSVGAPMTITTGLDPANATGEVTLYDTNGALLGTGTITNGVATVTFTNDTAGDATYTITYSGDASYQSNQITLGPVTIYPAWPQAAPMKEIYTPGQTLAIYLTDMATNWTGDNVKLTSITLTTANGIALGSSNVLYDGTNFIVAPGAALTYDNANPMTDQITYTITDRFGRTAVGSIDIYINRFGVSDITASAPGGEPVVNFYGYSGYNYTVLRSTNLLTTNWEEILTTNAPASPDQTGTFQYMETNAPQPAAFYRLRWNY